MFAEHVPWRQPRSGERGYMWILWRAGRTTWPPEREQIVHVPRSTPRRTPAWNKSWVRTASGDGRFDPAG